MARPRKNDRQNGDWSADRRVAESYFGIQQIIELLVDNYCGRGGKVYNRSRGMTYSSYITCSELYFTFIKRYTNTTTTAHTKTLRTY